MVKCLASNEAFHVMIGTGHQFRTPYRSTASKAQVGWADTRTKYQKIETVPYCLTGLSPVPY